MEVESQYRKATIDEKDGHGIQIRVGTRDSRLALIQTNQVISKLKQFYLNNVENLNDLSKDKQTSTVSPELKFNVLSMATIGDKILDKALPDIGSKSLFTKELEVELVEHRVDMIVHSLKDLPTTLPDGCVIGAVMARDDPNDAIVLKESLSNPIETLDMILGKSTESHGGFRVQVGTSSQRRVASLRRINPHVECVNIRGNVNTRLSKLDSDNGMFAAIVLAKAGLDRMGLDRRVSCVLQPGIHSQLEDWSYAVGQGAIAVECRSDDKTTLDFLKPIIDMKTTYEVIAERSLMKKLEGGCSVPLGVRSTWSNSPGGDILTLASNLLSIRGDECIKAQAAVKLPTENDGTITPISTSISDCAGVSLRTFDEHGRQNLIRCRELGLEVANKMISLGAIDLMSKVR